MYININKKQIKMKKLTLILMLFGAVTFGTTGCGNKTEPKTEHKGDGHEHDETTHEEGDEHNHSKSDTTHHEGDGHKH